MELSFGGSLSSCMIGEAKKALQPWLRMTFCLQAADIFAYNFQDVSNIPISREKHGTERKDKDKS